MFLTTHFMDEAQYLADRVAVIARGTIVAEGTPATLAGRDRMMTRIAVPRRRGASRVSPRWDRNPRRDGGWMIRAEDPTRPLHELTGWSLERGVALTTLEVSRPSLEDVYLEITGGEVSCADDVTAALDDVHAGPLHQQGVLAEPCLGLLHLRVPA